MWGVNTLMSLFDIAEGIIVSSSQILWYTNGIDLYSCIVSSIPLLSPLIALVENGRSPSRRRKQSSFVTLYSFGIREIVFSHSAMWNIAAAMKNTVSLMCGSDIRVIRRIADIILFMFSFELVIMVLLKKGKGLRA